MNVSPHKTGSDAIIYQLKCLDVDTIIVPQNLCPKVTERLSLNYNLKFAQVENHFEPANYIAAMPANPKKVAVLFVHPYGIYRENERNLVDNLCDFIIDDCCLCDPKSILQYKIKKNRRYAFSFGYSKVLDFGGGGLLVSPEPSEDNLIKLNIPSTIYGISAPSESDFNKTISLDNFIQTNFFSWLILVSEARNNHKNTICSVYNSLLYDKFEILNSPWRMILKASSELQAEILNILNNLDLDLFIGTNYPLLDFSGNEIIISDHKDDKGYVPINLFHDFRFDITRAKLLGNLIRGVVK